MINAGPQNENVSIDNHLQFISSPNESPEQILLANLSVEFVWSFSSSQAVPSRKKTAATKSGCCGYRLPLPLPAAYLPIACCIMIALLGKI